VQNAIFLEKIYICILTAEQQQVDQQAPKATPLTPSCPPLRGNAMRVSLAAMLSVPHSDALRLPHYQ